MDELDLVEALFSWPHPTSYSEALFMVDDVAERAVREVTTQSHERVQVALAEMGVVVATIAKLGVES